MVGHASRYGVILLSAPPCRFIFGSAFAPLHSSKSRSHALLAMVRSADVALRSFQDQLRATKAARTRIDTQQMAARREVGRDLRIEIWFDGDAEVRLHAPASRIACERVQ